MAAAVACFGARSNGPLIYHMAGALSTRSCTPPAKSVALDLALQGPLQCPADPAPRGPRRRSPGSAPGGDPVADLSARDPYVPLPCHVSDRRRCELLGGPGRTNPRGGSAAVGRGRPGGGLQRGQCSRDLRGGQGPQPDQLAQRRPAGRGLPAGRTRQRGPGGGQPARRDSRRRLADRCRPHGRGSQRRPYPTGQPGGSATGRYPDPGHQLPARVAFPQRWHPRGGPPDCPGAGLRADLQPRLGERAVRGCFCLRLQHRGRRFLARHALYGQSL